MKCKNFKILGIIKTSFFHINKYFGITFLNINYRCGSDSRLTQGEMAQRCDNLMHFKCLIVDWINSYSHIFEFNGWDLGLSNTITNQVLNQLTTLLCCHKISQHIVIYLFMSNLLPHPNLEM
jgi:hypothetical protein